jgi:hypothetical protein
MYCKFLKLTNGENIIVSTDDNCETFADKEFIDIVDPVLISSFRFPKGSMVVESFVMQPWIKMAVKDVMRLPVKNIVVATDVQEMAVVQYKSFVEESVNEITSELTEEDIEETLNEFLSDAGDGEEDQEDGPTDRTYH